MLGFRDASRYLDPGFQDGFELECRAIKRVREDMGLSNVQLMVPFECPPIRLAYSFEGLQQAKRPAGHQRSSRPLLHPSPRS